MSFRQRHDGYLKSSRSIANVNTAIRGYITKPTRRRSRLIIPRLKRILRRIIQHTYDVVISECAQNNTCECIWPAGHVVRRVFLCTTCEYAYENKRASDLLKMIESKFDV
jgi:hypothetical protein